MDDLAAIRETFFQECEELLADLEAGLLALRAGEGDGETVNAVFRAVHSVKGGAGAFGLDALVRFAHTFETALDKLRSGALKPDDACLKVLLRAADLLSDHVMAAKTGGMVEHERSQEAAGDLERLCSSSAPGITAQPRLEADEFDFTPIMAALPPSGMQWRVRFSPSATTYANGNDASFLLRELARLGECETCLDISLLPSLEDVTPNESYLSWSVILTSDASEAAIQEVFEFVERDCVVEIEPAPSLDIVIPPLAETTPAEAAPTAKEVAAPTEKTPAKTAAPGGQTTIRVDLERVDRLIDLVGELVINQAMLAQRVSEAELARASNVRLALESLEQLTREIQDSVMAIRAQPVKSVFQRMPRLLREIADATNKQVRLVMEGEGTEVDRTVIERLSDPITHMLRNAVDHGLERPDARVAAGKSAEGLIRLSAFHRSGRIVIEVADDGGGINRPRVRELAAERGLIDADAPLSDEEVDNLIFLPGFSTAKEVSNVSGRGVGMDVVKRSIQALGGRISIASRPGQGATFTLSLPLTLAVLDGMVVSVGAQTLIAPLATIVETLQPKRGDVHGLGSTGQLLAVRDAFVPLVDIGVALGWRSKPIEATTGVALLVESDVGGRAALLVDGIQGQRQVVIKSLEHNFQRVEGIAAATILGDGRVALILDVDALIGAHRREGNEGQRAPLLEKAS